MRPLCLLALVGCSDTPSNSLLRNPMDPFPESLADVGLYPDLADRSTTSSMARPYAPEHPLWTAGSTKSRYIVPNGDVDTTGDAWDFPAGTLFFKTFEYASGPVETRVMRRTEADWDYGTYQWTDGQAWLTPGDTLERVDVVNDDGTALTHNIPATLQCRTCHESSPSAALGFSEVQLASAPIDVPTADTIDSGDAVTDAFLSVMQGNCVHCHNGSDAPSASFDLRHPVAVDNTVGVATEGSASASGVRIVPGSPDDSILYLAMRGDSDDAEVATMPPLGVDLRDDDGLAIVRTFIASLETP